MDKVQKLENKKRHEEFRAYYWKKQTTTIFKISIWFLAFCTVCFFVVVPFEHRNYPELGRLKYGVSIIGHVLALCFSKWLLETKAMSESKKAVVSEKFAFVLGLLYLTWGVMGIDIAIKEYANPIILMYLILLAAITAFLYYPLHHFVWLIVISYAMATVCFEVNRDIVIMDPTSAICAVTMMLVLGVLSNTRYKHGRDRFEFERQNIKLIEEKESQNEELEAQNEELIAINQELNDTTDKLSRALEELEKASEAQKMFTSSMNHELRAPLNGIIGTIQVMLMNDKLQDSDKYYLEQCVAMSKSLLGIVNDLLDFAKMDAGEFEIFPEPFDLHELISNVEGTFRAQADNKGLQLKFDISDDTVCGLLGDDFRIQQVLTNIVSNGIKYTEKGSITVSASHDNDMLKFVVSDTGQGMSEESMKYLFVPFKRISESQNKKIQGTGLGMSIVMNLVKKMEGTINVDSTLGEGTTFTILIPSKITDANNTWGNPVKEDGLKENENTVNLNGKNILYVDDTKVNLTIVGKLLSDTGVQIITTDSPTEGLKLAQENIYDIIMIDHHMPEMSGPELLEEIRNKSGINKNTPVIAFTGNAGTGSEESYKRMGFAGYICKPVLKNNLLEVLKKVSCHCSSVS